MTVDPRHPLLVVVGGSTGVGTSTVVNSLVGRRVSATGVRRPTTRAPLLLHHPVDQAWFDGPLSVDRVADPAVPAGLALVDSPDIDSVDRHNRAAAAELAHTADVLLMVTSAGRYADAAPWELLRQAVARQTACAVLLNRVDADAADEVAAHLARLMTDEGLGDAPLVVITEQPGCDGLLSGRPVAPVAGLLSALAAREQAA